MNGKNARKLRIAAGGQEITEKREYFGREGNKKTFRLQKSSGRKRYQALKKVFYEMKRAA